MTAFLLHYVEFVKDLEVLKFEDARLADVYGFEKLPAERTAKVVEGAESFHDRAVFSTALLVRLYNALGPDTPLRGEFETHDAAARRTFALLYAKYNKLEVTPVVLAPSNLPPFQATEETVEMAKSADTTKVRRSRAPGVQRPIAMKPAGLVAEFKPTRPGTDRAKILKLMDDGTLSPAQIGTEMGGGRFDAKYIMAHAYCLRRDCGIGYEITKDGKLQALYPRGRSFEDAIRVPVDRRATKTRRTSAPVETAPESAAAE